MEGAGGKDRRRHAEQRSATTAGSSSAAASVTARADGADEDADEREVARRVVQLLLRVPDPGRHRQAREEAQRGEEIGKFGA